MRLEIDVNELTPRGVTGLRQAGSRKRYPRGTRGQLVRGTVEVQVAGFFRCRGIQNPHGSGSRACSTELSWRFGRSTGLFPGVILDWLRAFHDLEVWGHGEQ
jgi:hypothetical protein